MNLAEWTQCAHASSRIGGVDLPIPHCGEFAREGWIFDDPVFDDLGLGESSGAWIGLRGGRKNETRRIIYQAPRKDVEGLGSSRLPEDREPPEQARIAREEEMPEGWIRDPSEEESSAWLDARNPI
jgi:hypothetical protein